MHVCIVYVVCVCVCVHVVYLSSACMCMSSMYEMFVWCASSTVCLYMSEFK